MSVSVGLGIPLGQLIVGGAPVSPPTVVLQATAGISIVGLEPLAASDYLSAVPGTQVLSLGGIGVTLNGNGLAGWSDLSGGARHFAQGGAEAVCGVYTAVDATIASKGSVLFNGTSQWLPNTWNPPAPGTTPTWMRIIAKQIGRPTSGGQLIGSNLTNRFCVRSAATDNNANAGNGVQTGSVAMTFGAWFAVDVYFSASTSDYLHIGANKATGASLGTQDPNGFALASRQDGSAVWGNFAVAGFIAANVEPAGRLTTLNALCAKWWGPNVVLPS
jgi:hypothetical protein